MTVAWIEADWPAPAGVRAVSSLRSGGVSEGVFASLNLGGHVGDDPRCVAENRQRLRLALELPSEPVWLEQVHGVDVIDAADAAVRRADAAFTDRPDVVCAVMTADCLPILLCDAETGRVAAVHAGWRGLADGVVEAALQHFAGRETLAWIGPCIGADAFEVGGEVRAAFVARLGMEASAAFRAQGERWLCDLVALARLILGGCGVTGVYGGGFCTYRDAERFFSYRRDGQTGRMVTLIWRES